MTDTLTPIWLDDSAPVPVTVPFTRAQARAWGVDPRKLARWVGSGLLVHPIKGVYYAAQLADCLDLRLACLRLVVPEDAVVTDRTAAWLLGAPMALAPGDHLVVPPVSMFLPPGSRLRNKLTISGERTFAADEVVELGGVRVTAPLRTAADLGRLLHRDQAFAGMDSMMRLSRFTVGELVDYLERFRGHRGIVQARSLAPWVDWRSQSPGESILRLRWRDCVDLPLPEPQLEVEAPNGSYFLDLGVPGLRYAAEYDGAEWHGPEQREHDRVRREWVADRHDFLIDVFTGKNIHGRWQDADFRLRAGIAQARRRFGGHA
jgi:hypothetical protein